MLAKLLLYISLSTCALALLARGSTNGLQSPKSDSLKIKELISSAYVLKDANYEDACAKADEALYLARQSGNAAVLQEALAISAMLDWYDGRHQTALGKSYERLKLARFTHDTASVARSNNQIGMVYLYTANYDSALHYYNLALEDFISTKDTLDIIRTYGYIGLVYINRGDYLLAKENLLATVSIKRKAKFINWNVLQLSEGIEVNNKYYQEALLQTKEDLKKYPGSSPASLDKRGAVYNVGNAYYNLGIADSALLFYKASNLIARELQVDAYWNEEAKAHLQMGHYDSAIMLSKRALAEALDHGTRISQAISYRKIGEANYLQGEYQKALKAFSQSMVLDKAMGHRYSLMGTLRLMAEASLAFMELQKAADYAASSLSLAREIGAREGMVSAFKVASNVQRAMGNYREAMLYEDEHDKLWNELHESKTELDLARLDLLHDIDEQRLKIAELNRQNELTQIILGNQRIAIGVVVATGAIIAILLFLNYLRTQKLISLNHQLSRQQIVINDQNKALARSNQEKETLLGEIHHRVKNNLQVISSLLSMQQLELDDETARKAVMEGQSRVQTMGLIHESLYEHENFREIEMQTYLEQLVRNLMGSFGYEEHSLNVNINANQLSVEVNLAINIGLITNELVTNSLKYAFVNPDNPRTLNIVLQSIDTETLYLEVTDSGNQVDVDFERTNSFGLKLVRQLVKKYRGQIELNSTNGVKVAIFLNVNKVNE